MKKNNVLITGGNGFIGSHISNKLVEQGFNILTICRRNNSNNPIFNKNLEDGKIKIYQGDISSFDYLSRNEETFRICQISKKS